MFAGCQEYFTWIGYHGSLNWTWCFTRLQNLFIINNIYFKNSLWWKGASITHDFAVQLQFTKTHLHIFCHWNCLWLQFFLDIIQFRCLFFDLSSWVLDFLDQDCGANSAQGSCWSYWLRRPYSLSHNCGIALFTQTCKIIKNYILTPLPCF